MIEFLYPADLLPGIDIMAPGWVWHGRLPKAGGRDGRRGPALDVTMRFLDEPDLDELYRLHRTVVDALPDPDLFRADSLDFMGSLIRDRGRICGIFHDGRMAAYGAVSFPLPEDDDNLGRDLPLADEEMTQVAQYDGSAVHPEFRGYKLQHLTGAVRNAYALRAGHRHMFGTISPRNPYSLNNFLALGLTVRALKVKHGAYGGALRWLVHRDLCCDGLAVDPASMTGIPFPDIAAQTALLEQGYWGVGLIPGTPPRLVMARACHRASTMNGRFAVAALPRLSWTVTNSR